MPIALLRQALRYPSVIEEVLTESQEAGRIEMQAGRARLSGYAPVLSPAQQQAGTALLAALEDAGSQGRTLEELGINGSVESLEELAEFYVRQGTAVRVGPDRYYLHDALEGLARQALAEISRLGMATPAQLRDKLGLSRKYLIPLLEWLDLRGFTLRTGDARRLTRTGEKEIRALDGA
jgi:selenocysteine-specific elongation factor